MNKTPSEIRAKRTIGFLWLALVCFFNTVPLFVISVLANLDQVSVSNLRMLVLLTKAYLDQDLCFFPQQMGHRVSIIIRRRFWCLATYGVWCLWILLARHNEMAKPGMCTAVPAVS